MRYLEWNYDTHEAIEYRREGECNACGECCRAIIRFVVTKDQAGDWRV